VLAKNPGNVPARLVLGQAQLGTGKIDEAIATYKQVAAQAPNNSLAWFDLANAYAGRAVKDDAAFAESQRAYERALSLQPRHADTYLNLASLEASRGDPEQSKRTLLRARAAGISDPLIETEIGMLEAAHKNVAAARIAFEKALQLNPAQPEALEAMGQLSYAAGDFTAAAGYYERALAARPQARVAKTLGAIRLYQLNDPQAARVAFARALSLSPADDPDAPDLKALIEQLAR
jgi:tetratricopeptide (TPR) repeat protein